jgi:hypothetical protein
MYPQSRFDFLLPYVFAEAMTYKAPSVLTQAEARRFLAKRRAFSGKSNC